MNKKKSPLSPWLLKLIDDPANALNDKMAVKFAKVLSENLNSRFPDFGTNRDLNSFGNYLNPCLKGIHLKSMRKLEETKDALEEKLGVWKKDDMADTDDVEVEEPPRKLTPTEMLKKKMRLVEEERGQGIRMRITNRRSSIFSNIDSSSKFRKECFVYESLPDPPSTVAQLDWWKNHSEQFPLLLYLVRVVFGVPVASSKSERVFSVAGNTVTPKRASLGTDTTESLVIIKTNLGILKEMGIRK